jgi:hypothetical protein
MTVREIILIGHFTPFFGSLGLLGDLLELRCATGVRGVAEASGWLRIP